MTTDIAFIIDIKVKPRVPGESWDVFGRYLNDDPIPLGTVVFNTKAHRDDQWEAHIIGGQMPIWCPTKHQAVERISGALLDYFDSVECRYGKRVWRRARLG